jgi:flagellar hook-associated protein 2
MGMALSGLASGFDWKSIVDQLIEVSRAPQNRMRTEKSSNASKSSAINEIKGLLSTFKSSLTSLASEEALYKKSATFKDTSTNWKASASKDTPAGEYKFNFSSEATSSKLTGSTGLVSPLVATDSLSNISVGRTIVGGAGKFVTVNGTQIAINTTDDLQTTLSNFTAAGVTASLAGDRIKLVSNTANQRISLGAPNDTSNFLQAMRLSGQGTLVGSNYEVTSANPDLSAPKLNVPLNSSGLNALNPVVDGVTETILINGVSIGYTKNDTVQMVMDRINESTAGVTAIYDISQGKFSLTNKTTGNVGISVQDTALGTLGAALGLTTGTTLVNGSDATFSVNGGGSLTSRSNILDETAHGIKGLSVTANSVSNQTLTVAGDYSSAKDSLNDFIAKYNAVQNAIEKYTKVTISGDKVSSAILAGNRELSVLSRSLRTALYQSGTGITGTVKRLSDLGINFAGIESTISLTKSSVLESKIATATDDISEFLQGNTTNADQGLIDRLDKLLGSYVSDSGTASGGLKAQLDSITKQNTSLDKQIEEVERRLASQRSLLENSFIAMEKAQSQFQQQSSYLAKTFSGSK